MVFTLEQRLWNRFLNPRSLCEALYLTAFFVSHSPLSAMQSYCRKIHGISLDDARVWIPLRDRDHISILYFLVILLESRNTKISVEAHTIIVYIYGPHEHFGCKV